MKKIILLCLTFILMACYKDDSFENVNETTPEKSPDGMKIRLLDGDYLYQYFYHENGFIDSVYVKKETEISHKFIYNDLNQIIEDQYTSKDLVNSSNYSIRTTKYAYNRLNQISHSKVYDKENKLLTTIEYQYNADGSLYNPTKIVKDENLIAVNSRDNYNTYTFDSTINPYYNIYPKAFKVIKYINKNNILIHEIKTPYQTIQYSYELTYNERNYLKTQYARENGWYRQYSKFHYYE